uniref:CZB domain-containing protein n=1 Tax=Escherichia coli TaxID=562 RepID=UPI001562372E
EIICDVQFLYVTKIDHVIWKFNVYSILLDRKFENHVTTHTECRLGEWYYNHGVIKYHEIPGFRSVEQPHKTVHKAGVAAIKLYQNSDLEGLGRELELMETASNEVIHHIDTICNCLMEKTSQSI